jgi:6-phosphogluconolactonase
MLRKLVFAVLVFAISLFGVTPAFAQSADKISAAGAVYIMSNAADGNVVMAYTRYSDGSLVFSGSYPTGGLGSGVGVTVPPDPLGSQNALLLSPDGKWLFAANAGSDDVSVFKVLPNGLKRTDRAGSGGDYPVSLTYRHGLLYVLNAAGDGSIQGFRLSDSGHLKAVDGSTRSLNANTPADGAQPQILESPSEVGFTPNGDFLVVIDKGGVSGQGRILTFALDRHGMPAAQPVITVTANPVPFDFTFDASGHLVVVDASAGSITSYAIRQNGTLDTISSVLNGQAAVCWITGDPDKGLVFTDNTGSGTLSSLTAGEDGMLTLLGQNGYSAVTGAGTLPLDMGISHDGGYIYSLLAGAGKIGITQVNPDGSLTVLGAAGSFPAFQGYQGIAVW